MSVIAVIGAQWGDEGKGKIVDLIAEKSDLVARFSGGDNAGHTVINSYGEFKLHLIPSGIFSPKAVSIIGNGVAVNPKVICEEIDMVKNKGVDTSRLFISDRANLIMPYHLLFDRLEESALGGKAIGTTLKGIGPCFSDKIARRGIRFVDIINKDVFKNRLKTILDQKNLLLTNVYHQEPLSFEDIYNEYVEYADRLGPIVRETSSLINEALENGKLLLLEGAQGSLLDPDFGTYPYCTSSSPLSGGACVGAGIGPTKVNSVIGVFKAYCSRVGEGPFPTELNNETGDNIRERAHEYGTTTGRPRRCGWFDGVVAKFTSRINGFTGMALTRLDILDTLPELKVCTGYKLDGQIINYFPSNVETLAKCEPVYETLPGWQTSIEDIRNYEELPAAAKQYISRIEELANCPAKLISVGPARDQTIERLPLI